MASSLLPAYGSATGVCTIIILVSDSVKWMKHADVNAPRVPVALAVIVRGIGKGKTVILPGLSSGGV